MLAPDDAYVLVPEARFTFAILAHTGKVGVPLATALLERALEVLVFVMGPQEHCAS